MHDLGYCGVRWDCNNQIVFLGYFGSEIGNNLERDIQTAWLHDNRTLDGQCLCVQVSVAASHNSLNSGGFR